MTGLYHRKNANSLLAININCDSTEHRGLGGHNVFDMLSYILHYYFCMLYPRMLFFSETQHNLAYALVEIRGVDLEPEFTTAGRRDCYFFFK